MRISEVLAAYREHQVPPQYLAALAREYSQLTCTPTIAGAEGPPFRYLRGGRQGGPATPTFWNRLWSLDLLRLEEQWRQDGKLFALAADDEPRWWTITVWADNFYLLSSSKVLLEELYCDLRRAATTHGQHFKTTELQVWRNAWVDSAEADGPIILAQDTATQTADLTVLGVAIDAKGSTTAAWAHRRDCARAHWHAGRSWYCNKRVGLATRLRAWAAKVGTAFLWGAGGWTPNATLLMQTARWEMRMLRAMLGWHKSPAEEWRPWLRRANAAVRRHCARARIVPLPERWLRLHHRWMGHCARADPARYPAAAVLHWRPLAWWRAMQCCGPYDHSGQRWRHPHPTVGERVELAITAEHGETWQTMAQDRAKWQRLEDGFVDSWLQRAGLPPRTGHTSGRNSEPPPRLPWPRAAMPDRTDLVHIPGRAATHHVQLVMADSEMASRINEPRHTHHDLVPGLPVAVARLASLNVAFIDDRPARAETVRISWTPDVDRCPAATHIRPEALRRWWQAGKHMEIRVEYRQRRRLLLFVWQSFLPPHSTREEVARGYWHFQAHDPAGARAAFAAMQFWALGDLIRALSGTVRDEAPP